MTSSESRGIEFALSSGVTLRGDAWGDAAAQPVLLLHGGGQTRHSWSGTARALAERGYYAVTLDQRGHGESDWSEDGHYDFDAFASDAAEVARKLPSNPALVGASLGGIASLVAHHESRHEIGRALVLVDVATKLEPVGVGRIMDFMTGKPEGFADLDEAADAVAAYNPLRKRPEDVSGLAKNLRQAEDGRWHWHWDPRFVERTGPAARPEEHVRFGVLDDAARGLEIPTLLVRGKLSDVLSEDGAQHFLSQATRAEYVDISGAGHMVAGDKNDAFSQAVLDFLAKHCPA